ncbi:MAG TPA: hypothetical protein VMS17_19795 [Gemmataceae bacterium]|nr:hypothetical protein [Gemmataceae bacterium]
MNAKSTMRTVWCAVLTAAALSIPTVVRAEVYGGIEIGGKGVKATVLDATGQGENLEIVVKLADSTNTGLASDVAKDGRFGDAALAETVKAVAAYRDRFRKDFGAADGRISVVGSSGLFAAIEGKPDLIKINQAQLATAVKGATGLDMNFIDVQRESELSIAGIVPNKHRGDAFLIDVGGGNTKGGCQIEAGKFATFGVPFGTATFSELAKKEGAGDATAMAKLCEEKVAPLLKKGLSDIPDMAKRDPIYLSGGVVWSAATFAHPQDAKPYTPLTRKDVQQFEAALAAGGEQFPTPDLSGITDEAVRARAKSEWERVKKVYTPEQLLAGVQVLKSAMSAAGEDKHFLFARNGYLGWILAYVTESAAGPK